MRRISDEGLEHIRRWEGVRLKAYVCPGGALTIGYGSTGPHVKDGMTITPAQAEALLREDLERFEDAVSNMVKVPLTDNQFAALVSFAFNIGVHAFARSTLLNRLNAGDYDAVPSELAKWNKAGGKPMKGLANRRAAEAGLWVKGAYVASAGPTTAEPEAPATLTKENISWAATLAGSMGALFSGGGPVQWAFAAVIIAGAIVGGYLFIKQRMAPA